MTTRDIAEGSNINREMVRQILYQELGMRKVCAKLVPKNLAPKQKARRVELCEEWMNADLKEGILNRVVTGDESWVYEYDPCNKRKSMEWKTTDESRPKKARMSKSKVKSMLITFFDCQGVLLKEWAPPGKRSVPSTIGKYYGNYANRITVLEHPPVLARSSTV